MSIAKLNMPGNLPGGIPAAGIPEGAGPGPPIVAGGDGTVGGAGGTPLNAAAIAAPVTARLALTFLEGTIAARPAAGTLGRSYYATDTGVLYFDTGTAWVLDSTFLSGTQAALPAAGTLGRSYYATDTGVLYFDTGSAWLPVPLDGAWNGLGLTANILSTTTGGASPTKGYPVSARQEGGNVRLRGGLVNNTGATVAAGTTLATLPVALYPTVPLYLAAGFYTSGGTWASTAIEVSSAGAISCFSALPATNSTLYLDGVEYSIT